MPDNALEPNPGEGGNQVRRGPESINRKGTTSRPGRGSEETAERQPEAGELLAALEFCATAPLQQVHRTVRLAAAMVYKQRRGNEHNRDSRRGEREGHADWADKALSMLETIADAPNETKSKLLTLAVTIGMATLRTEPEEPTQPSEAPAGSENVSGKEPPPVATSEAAVHADDILTTLLLQRTDHATARRTYSMCAHMLRQREQVITAETTSQGRKSAV